MQTNELAANLSTAHLVGHIEYLVKKAESENDRVNLIAHLQALIRACELNPAIEHWRESYILKLNQYV